MDGPLSVSRVNSNSTPLRSELGSDINPLKVAVVGSGPSGFYAVQALLASKLHVEVDVLERLPTPFGLVRYGVAPDHTKLKSASDVFTKIAQDPRMCFWGNVTVGRDITVEELRSFFHVIIFATGSDSDRRLNIEGEELCGVYTAREFVGWYNGHPDYAARSFDLQHESAVVIGHGNVAIDICRILTTPIDKLRKTDIAQHALEVLSESRISQIQLVGRRGPVQANFTYRVLRELAVSENCQLNVQSPDLVLEPACKAELQLPGNGEAIKNMKVFDSCAKSSAIRSSRSIHLHFKQSPRAFLGTDRVCHVEFERQTLTGAPGRQCAQSTGIVRTLEAGLVFKSTGYLGTALPGLPFDSSAGVIPNDKGRVTASSGTMNTVGLYVTGWIKRGATGVIGTNRVDSIETVAQVLDDLRYLNSPRKGRSLLRRKLATRAHQAVSFDDWLHIEQVERARGQLVGRPAEKMVTVNEMLNLVSAASREKNSKFALSSVEQGKYHAHQM